MTREGDQSHSFIGSWLLEATKRYPESAVLEAILDATQDDVLDEEKLLEYLQYMASPGEEEEES